MSEQRIPTTERHAELVEVAARAVMLASTTHAHDEDMPLKNEVGVAEAVIAAVEPMIRAEYEPDVSVGDVIHAEPDGTITLDDGITTWNPSRATAFLVAERERRVVEGLVATIKALDVAEQARGTYFGPKGTQRIFRDVLAVVEAASREDTT